MLLVDCGAFGEVKEVYLEVLPENFSWNNIQSVLKCHRSVPQSESNSPVSLGATVDSEAGFAKTFFTNGYCAIHTVAVRCIKAATSPKPSLQASRRAKGYVSPIVTRFNIL